MKKAFILFAFISFLTLKAQIPAHVPTNGLMGYWPFSGNANDLSGSGYHGTVYGAQLASDRFNNAASSYSFNGTSNYILTQYQGILGANARAVSFWAKTSIANSVITGVAWGSNSSGNRFGCGFNYGGSGATIGAANGAITYGTPTPIYDNQWHHYVFQFSGGTVNNVQIYQDAVLLTQQVHAFNPNVALNTINGFNVQFGRVDYFSADYFKGQLDDIGIWNRILSQCEILQLFNGLPQIVANGSTTLCGNGSVVLSSNTQGSYNWNNGATTQSITVTSPGSYYVAVTLGTCALNSNTISVALNPIPDLTATSSASTLCVGQSGTISVTGADTYSWSTGASGNMIAVNPTITTTYTITGFLNNCSATILFTQNVSECTSLVENNTRNLKLEVYPNPAANEINITVDGIHIPFMIFDSQGKLIKRCDLPNKAFNISDLPDGLYLVRTKEGFNARFIKIR